MTEPFLQPKSHAILIVDDNPQNLQVLGKMLQEKQYDIEFATNGLAALDWLNSKPFDLILLDINMPGMNGFEVCEKIRSNPELNIVPVIFLSANTDRESILKGFEYGGQDYITKPFDARELLVRVRTHLNLKNSMESLDSLNKSLEEKVKERTLQLETTNLELISARDRALESDKLKSAFLNNISHEIRTPFNGILGFLSLIQLEKTTEASKTQYIEIINQNAQRLLNTINDIVEISQIQAGIIKLEFNNTNINTILKDQADRLMSEIVRKKLEFRILNNIQKDLENVKTDGKKLNSILSNLLNNAVKFTNSGSIEIGVRNDSNALEFSIKDSGIGIPEEKWDAIFDRFIQEDVSITRQYEGSGLGLSITKAYVELLGGKIWVKSETGKGSVFYFTIPVPELVKEKPSFKNNKSLIEDEILKKSLRILLAENDYASIMYISAIIENISKELIVVKTGIEAVETCRKHEDIDVILMDINMLEMDGYEATRQIRQFNKKVIIIAQTAFGLPGDYEKAIDAGCNDYISKPIVYKELVDLIKLHITLNNT
jgi:signal transduction histidine kinase